MILNMKRDRMIFGTGFWAGVVAISLVNIALGILHNYPIIYSGYMLVISSVVLTAYLILGRRPAVQ
jgi:hypothetical protein